MLGLSAKTLHVNVRAVDLMFYVDIQKFITLDAFLVECLALTKKMRISVLL